jgi:heat-inducible transcriptional repressor
MTLKPRQEQVLRAVVEEYIASGFPVGSKYLSEHVAFGVAASTIRNDLAHLEETGLLAHPHTSAGRVPTDAGYRHYVDALAERPATHAESPMTFDRASMQREIDEALGETAEALSRVTELMAVISAPSLSATTIRHIEVLSLQPRAVMVVIITTAGRVTKRVFQFERSVDPGLAEYARVYLNERLTGVQLGTRLIESAFDSPDLGVTERGFLAAIKQAFTVVNEDDGASLYMGGTSRLVERLSQQGVTQLNELLAVLEQRFNLLGLLYGALREDGVYLRIGHEMTSPTLQACSLVAANYGVGNRNLGTVSVLGPTRMDYQNVIAVVRATADSLSGYLEEIW